MSKQDQKGYVLTLKEYIKGLENLISHLASKTGNTLPDTHPYMMKLQEVKNQLQRKEWMQETEDAFAEINAECN
jgi:galactose-1-phosphate uridylyltransferase